MIAQVNGIGKGSAMYARALAKAAYWLLLLILMPCIRGIYVLAKLPDYWNPVEKELFFMEIEILNVDLLTFIFLPR